MNGVYKYARNISFNLHISEVDSRVPANTGEIKATGSQVDSTPWLA